MSKKNKKKKKKSQHKEIFPLPLNALNVSRYTLDVWLDAYPESDKDEWLWVAKDSILEYLFAAQDNLIESMGFTEENFPKKVHIVPLDGAYLAWLKIKGLENTDEARLEYINIPRTEDEYMEMLKRNDWHHEYQLLGIPVDIIALDGDLGTTHFVLSEETVEELKKYLSTIYKSWDIFVSKYILKADEYFNHTDRFLSLANAYFDGHKVSLGKWENQTHKKGVNMTRLIIPFIARKTFDTAAFDITKLGNTAEWLIMDEVFTSESFENLDISGLEPMEGSCVEKMIEQDIGKEKYHALVMPFSIYADEIPEYLKESDKALGIQLKHEKKNFTKI